MSKDARLMPTVRARRGEASELEPQDEERLPRPRLLTLVEWGFFLTLPVERSAVFDVAGFTIRPVYFFMAAFVLLRRPAVFAGFRAMPTVSLVLAAALISLPFTHSFRLSLGYALWAGFVSTFALAAVGELASLPGLVPRWIRLYVVSAGAWSLVAVAQWFASFADPDLPYAWLGSVPRVHALALEPSFFAFYLVTPLLLSLTTGLRGWSVAILTALIASTSRTGLLGMLVGVSVLLLIGDRRTRLRLVAGGAVAAVLFALQSIPSLVDYRPQLSDASAGSYGSFVYEGITAEDTASAVPRLESWRLAWELFADNPGTGVGVGAFGAALHDQGIGLGSPASALKTTNLWLEVSAEMGIVGLIALLAWTLMPVPELWKRRRQSGLAVAVLAAIVASLAMFPFVQTWWVPYRWMPWVFAYVLYRRFLDDARRVPAPTTR